MKYLAFDVGNRRTGVAYLDEVTGIPLPLDTIHHASEKELLSAVINLAKNRRVDHIVVGLPKLLNGDEGTQAKISRKIGDKLIEAGFAVSFVDERYTTPRLGPQKHAPPSSSYDGDGAAACQLLSGKI